MNDMLVIYFSTMDINSIQDKWRQERERLTCFDGEVDVYRWRSIDVNGRRDRRLCKRSYSSFGTISPNRSIYSYRITIDLRITNIRLHTKPTSIKCCRICSVSSNFCNCLFDHRCSNLIRQLTMIDEINNIHTLHQSLKTSVLSLTRTRRRGKNKNSVLVDREMKAKKTNKQ